MYQCQLCEDQDINNHLSEETTKEEMIEKYEELFKKELEEGIVKESIPILIKAITKFRLLVDSRLINIATQIVISIAEDEIEKQNIEREEEHINNKNSDEDTPDEDTSDEDTSDEDASEEDTSNEDTSDEDNQKKEIFKIRLSGNEISPKRKL